MMACSSSATFLKTPRRIRFRVGALVVTNAEGYTVGITSERDIVPALGEKESAGLRNANRSSRQLNPSASQSFISLLAFALRAIEVIFSSSLRRPEGFRAPARKAELTAEQTCA